MDLFGRRSFAALQSLNAKIADLEARCGALETRCGDLAGTLAAREAELRRVGLEEAILARRVDEAQEQAAKTATALIQRMEDVRRTRDGAAPVS